MIYNIAVIEDDLVDFQVIQRLFGDKALLSHFTSGESALQSIANDILYNVYDCVLLDYSLPGENGSDIFKKIKAINADMPVIIITGQGDEELAVKFMKEGVLDYIIKDHINSKLLDAVYHCITYKIMVIEDDPIDFEKVHRILGDNIELVHFVRGESALQSIQDNEFDCVLLDYHLPGEDGLTILERLKKLKPNIPIIIMTGCGDEELAVQFIKKGAADYITKNNIGRRLLDAISDTISGSRFRRKLRRDLHEVGNKLKEMNK